LPVRSRRSLFKIRESLLKIIRISRRRVLHLSAESASSLGGECFISRRRVPYLSAESTSSLGREYRISRQRVPHLSAESTASLGGEYRISRLRVLHLSESGTGQTFQISNPHRSDLRPRTSQTFQTSNPKSGQTSDPKQVRPLTQNRSDL
jgi:hypothetical protein